MSHAQEVIVLRLAIFEPVSYIVPYEFPILYCSLPLGVVCDEPGKVGGIMMNWMGVIEVFDF